MLRTLQFDVKFTVGIVLTRGTKRAWFYRNEYGTETGCNLIPRHFGIAIFLSHDAYAKPITRLKFHKR